MPTAAPHRFRLNRRQFLTITAVTGAAGAGLLWQWDGGRRWWQRLAGGAPGVVADGHYFNAWLEITPDNAFIFTLDKMEMGQGVINSLTAIVAEELNMSPARLQVQLATLGAARRNPLYRPTWGTGASSSVRSLWQPLRQAGALARELFRRAAAAQWQVPVERCELRDGVVAGPAGELACRALLARVAELPAPAATPKSPQQFQWLGRALPKLDHPAKIDGSAKYGIDRAPAFCPVAVVLRAPANTAWDAGIIAAAQAQPGVLAAFPVAGGLALVADSAWRALAARAALPAVAAEPGSGLDSGAIRQRLLDALDTDAPERVLERGATDAPAMVDATYFAPYLAQLPMEPLNCTVLIQDGEWTVWVSTQRPALALEAVQRVSGLPAERIGIYTTLIGGGFGRRLHVDFIEEAALIAKQFGGSVQLLWTRADELAGGFYRPAAAARLRLALRGEDRLEVIQRIASVEVSPLEHADWRDRLRHRWRLARGQLTVENQTAEGAAPLAYDPAGHRLEAVYLGLPIRTGMWRSTGHSFNTFFVESAIDELAHARGEDPVAMRRRLLAAQPRVRRALEAAAEAASRARSPGTGLGYACHFCYGTAIALAVEVAVSEQSVRLVRVTGAIDCGTVIDPDGVRAQVEGGALFGLCAALYGEVAFRDGAAISSGFADYPVLRMGQSPAMEVILLPSELPPAGVGEAATAVAAPALCNAVFAAGGGRCRSLPVAGFLAQPAVEAPAADLQRL